MVAARQNKLAEASRILARPELSAPEVIAADALIWMRNRCLTAHDARHSGDLAAARRLVEEARQVMVREHYETTQPAESAIVWRELAWLEKALKNFAAAERAARQMALLADTATPANANLRAEAILDQGSDPAALEMLEGALSCFSGQYGPGHSFTLNVRLTLAKHLRAAGRGWRFSGAAARIADDAVVLPESFFIVRNQLAGGTSFSFKRAVHAGVLATSIGTILPAKA